MREDEDALRARGLDESRSGDRLAGRGRVAESEAAHRTRIGCGQRLDGLDLTVLGDLTVLAGGLLLVVLDLRKDAAVFALLRLGLVRRNELGEHARERIDLVTTKLRARLETRRSLAQNSLEPGDLILRIEIPVQQSRSAYMQVSEKSMFDWALVSCATAAKVEGGKLTQPRLVLGAISNVPHQVKAANDFLEGKKVDNAVAENAADLLLEKAEPLSDNGYKLLIARTLIRRTLLQLTT